jgi:hypothetical protein
MTLSDIVPSVGGRIPNGDGLAHVDVSRIIASDLMSDGLRYSRQGSLLVTGNANLQSVGTARISELAGVPVVRNKMPDARTLEPARSSGIFLAVTELDTFEVCGRLYQKMHARETCGEA